MKRLAIVCSLGLSCFGAFAGLNGGSEVVISGDLAYGSYGDVRYSADSTQYISCYTQHPSGGTTYGGCQARSASGASKSCYTTDPAMLTIIQSMGSRTDYVWFRTDASGGCSRISAVSGSHML